MTDFSNVRIPATRMGVGSSQGSGARIRRHVAKGFYDEVPGAGTGDVVVNNVSTWPDGNEKWYNIWSKTLSGNTSNSLAGPDFIGQVLLVTVDTANSYSWTLTTSLVTDGASNYTSVVLNADGENIMFVGVKKAGTLRWYVIKNHGAALS